MIDFPHSKGFEVIPDPIAPGPNGQTRIILKVTNNLFIDVFSVLIKDIIDHILLKTEQREVINEFISRLKRWQAFLQVHPLEGLGRQEQRGLYGELWFLRNIALENINSVDTVNAWVGPGAANQDYQFPECAVEVKTTSSGPHEKVQVSNTLQLDDTGLDNLLLFHISLNVQAGGNQSLPELVKDIRDYLSHKDLVALCKFEDLLVDSGYLDIHRAKYENEKYSIRHRNFYKVESNFPRIKESSLLPGVGDVRYSISIPSCNPFKITDDKAIHYIQGRVDNV